MQFTFTQIATCPPDSAAAMKLLAEMNWMGDWVRDRVKARGTVFGSPAESSADLAFNYKLGPPGVEFEILNYVEGQNWMQQREERDGICANRVSHIGVHCTENELNWWKHFFAKRGIEIAQELQTKAHTNPSIAGRRWYHYVIFDTFAILGFDVKFIVRREHPPSF